MNSDGQVFYGSDVKKQFSFYWTKTDQDEPDWLFGWNQIKLVQIVSDQVVWIFLIGSNWIMSDQSELNEINWTKLVNTRSNKIK